MNFATSWLLRAVAARGWILLVVLVFATPGAMARTLTADGVVERLQSWLDGTRDLSGAFEQEMESGALGAGLEESGRMFLARPGRMRWDYVDPERKIALVEGDRTRLYIEEDAQLWEGRLDESGAALPLLLAGQTPLSEVFRATLDGTPRRGGAGSYLLKLTPISGAEGFEELQLALDPDSFSIRAARVLDSAGNRMLYRFLDLQRNEGLPETTFHFEPPAGTEIVLQP